jgi:hypothetical protein
MRALLVAAAGGVSIVGGQLVGEVTRDVRKTWPATENVPYAPSDAAAPFISLGYREAAADLMWIRTLGYLGRTDDTSKGVRDLVYATHALDDHFRPVYDVGAVGIQAANRGVDNDSHLAAIDLFVRGMRAYPDKWEYPALAGQTYLVDLKPNDAAQQREWTERAVDLFETAMRLPGAPERLAGTVAYFQDKIGRHELAVQSLQARILLAQDPRARLALIKQLAELEDRDEIDLRIAMLESRRAFVDAWTANRPALPPSMYLILGKRRNPYLPRQELAVDRDLVGANPPDELEPLYEGDDAEPAPEPPRPPGEYSDSRGAPKP